MHTFALIAWSVFGKKVCPVILVKFQRHPKMVYNCPKKTVEIQVLEAFWSVLEASLKSLGPSWAEKGGQHGSKFGAKKNVSKKRSVLWRPLGWDDQSGEGLLMHTVALIAWTVLICFWGEGGSRYSGKTPKASKNGLQLCPKTIKFQARGRQSWSPEGSWAGLGTSCAILGQLGRFWQLFGASWKRRRRVLGRLEPKKVANMVTSWAPKR